MCGICGEIAKDRPADMGAIGAMCQTMVPRGPDAAGSWSQGSIGLGHRRLQIIDLSPAGSQPMHDADLGLTVAFNGCIYNYPQLREELIGKGYRFFSHSDTEVILKGYHAWGSDVVTHLFGMFAFAITERDTGRVMLARDRLGIKPLYWAQTADSFRFASSLPALVNAGGIDTSLDPVALHQYLSFHSVVPAPHTILAGVRKLAPATLMFIEPDGTRTERTYWTLEARRRSEHAEWTDADWTDALHESLRVAVRRRLVADVPVGCLLSGGLDSSLIVGLLAEEGQHGLATFSIGFEAAGGESGDEFQYSDVIARHFATDHHQIRIDTARMLPALGDAIHAMNEPMVSHDAVAFYLLSQEVAKHVKVVQSGQGADEVFAGYHWYPPMTAVGDADIDGAVATYRKAFFDRTHDGVAALLQPQWLVDSDVSGEFVREHFARPYADSAIDRALRLDSQVMLVDDPVKRVDSMTMAWGLEARVPFLDHELVELAFAAPAHLKTAQDGKGVLKDIGRQVIPAEVIDRPKGYFPVPALKHLQGPYLDMVRDALTSRAARDRGLYRPEAVDRLLADPNGNLTPLRGNPLWQIALLELWLQSHGIGGR
ncbi:N-acetylglutaminylglutamine amidotransferase [Granulicoccus phenolivorans]|uniref:N-acetylglutaminylglutamine amidotransferase n=1 Tax=Granulicoccus phenolivorans TaxID=266854 RepID=UPI00047B4A6D|nr:N-acetylglutaminylglutamine amidotransferase [Granulicoccus phenolivorans]